jgi:hypothetical protein
VLVCLLSNTGLMCLTCRVGLSGSVLHLPASTQEPGRRNRDLHGKKTLIDDFILTSPYYYVYVLD